MARRCAELSLCVLADDLTLSSSCLSEVEASFGLFSDSICWEDLPSVVVPLALLVFSDEDSSLGGSTGSSVRSGFSTSIGVPVSSHSSSVNNNRHVNSKSKYNSQKICPRHDNHVIILFNLH